MLVDAHFLRESPEMSIDPFSEILSLTHAQAVHAGGFTAGGPWAIRFLPRHRIKMSAVLKGACWLWLEGEPEPVRLPNVANWLPEEKLQREHQAIGFYLSAHPLDAYEALLGRLRVQTWAQFSASVKRNGLSVPRKRSITSR